MARRTEPAIETIDARALGQDLDRLLDRVTRNKARIVVEKSGVPVVALVSAEDFTRMSRLEAEREARFSVIEQARTAFKDVLDDELEAEVAGAIAQARAELLAEREKTVHAP